MKKDIKAIMQKEKLDAMWITGPMHNNPDMVYFTGTCNVGNADLFIFLEKQPLLFHSDMEREEAAKSGFQSISLDQNYPFEKYLKQSQGDILSAQTERYIDILKGMKLTSEKIGLFGRINIGMGYALIDSLKSKLPNIHFEGYLKDSPLEQVRKTKDSEEVERIRRIAKTTVEVVDQTAKFLCSCKTEDNIIYHDGRPVTIGQIKNRINLWLAERGADNPEATIFSIGRDAGIPHNSGNPDDKLELGKPIIFDIFPCEKGGEYFYDFTRTWCLGFAPEDVLKLHKQVFDVHQQIISELAAGKPFNYFQERTCDLFYELGHETIKSNPKTQEGYVHSIGHGLGLQVHESPFSGITSGEKDILHPGVTFTIEPGLYYPSKNIGVRIEDTIYLHENGVFEIFADYPYDLVIPVGI